MGFESTEWINLGQDWVHLVCLVNTVVNLVFFKGRSFSERMCYYQLCINPVEC
jgi:hypothetical protein